MRSLHFTTKNAQETAGAFVQLSGIEANFAGELEDHGGIMGCVRGVGGELTWSLALANLGDMTGEGLLVIEWDPTHPPEKAVMDLTFEALDMPLIQAQLVPEHRLEDYPSWLAEL